jgi:hypothetical protein
VTAESVQWPGLKDQRISCIANTKLKSKSQRDASTFNSLSPLLR